MIGILLAGCATDEAPASLGEGVRTEPIWGQTPGAHQTTKEVAWEQVSTSLSVPYALTSTSAGAPAKTTLRLFYRDSGGCLRHFSQFDGALGWTNDATLNSCGSPGFDGPPAAIAWSATRYDLFWFYSPLFSNAHLMHLFWDGAAWYTEDLGANATSGAAARPSVGSWASGHIDVMWRDGAGDLRHRIFDRAKKGAPGFGANGWSLADVAVRSFLPNSPLAVAEPAVGEIDVAYRNTVGTLTNLVSKDSGATWTVENPGFAIDSSPALASWGSGSLMAVALRSSSSVPFRQMTRDAAGWHDVGYATAIAAGNPVAAASPSRPYRVDLMGSPDGAALYHGFYQESLPGFMELTNPDTEHWCWANASGMVVNYLAQGTAGWTPQATCQFVGVVEGQNCCGAIADDDCYTAGDHVDVLDAYGVSWEDRDIYTFDQLREELQVRHKPVIVREAHNNTSGGHVVVLRDVYRFAGTNYVELADPANNGRTWVWPYDKLIAYDTNWHVDYMERGYKLE